MEDYKEISKKMEELTYEISKTRNDLRILRDKLKSPDIECIIDFVDKKMKWVYYYAVNLLFSYHANRKWGKKEYEDENLSDDYECLICDKRFKSEDYLDALEHVRNEHKIDAEYNGQFVWSAPKIKSDEESEEE